jgi:hypothetical protein
MNLQEAAAMSSERFAVLAKSIVQADTLLRRLADKERQNEELKRCV